LAVVVCARLISQTPAVAERGRTYIGPPVLEFPVLVILTSHLVERVRELVTGDGSKDSEGAVLGAAEGSRVNSSSVRGEERTHKSLEK
jgi:hypothetical protein